MRSREQSLKSLTGHGWIEGPGKAREYLGCFMAELISYLEAKFASGMTWSNHRFEWEVDHIKEKEILP